MLKAYHFKELRSTSEKAREFKVNSVIIADSQTKGKGRFKRRWSSLRGGAYMSIVLEPFEMSYLTFAAALSVYNAIKDTYRVETVIKWPNDLTYNKKKVCGILTQAGDKAIVGIGINTNNKIPKSLKDKAVSLSQIIGKDVDNKRLINAVLRHLEAYIEKLKNKKYNKIINEWKKRSFLGSEVVVRSIGKTYRGTATDVDKDCFLIIKDKKGKKTRIIEGDVIAK
ncbi:biotin--[acetyl-CoA-carboxylase] ligase [Candidatus Woesearchaeota archaeon]|nr:biotin--[acetyl-CoA-carboxylase] ligase [Candidatus Woesearchaeota archaeon]